MAARSMIAGVELFAAGARFLVADCPVASGLGSRLSLCAALAPDLAVAAPSSELSSLAPLLRPGAPRQIGAAPGLSDVLGTLGGAGASRCARLASFLPQSSASGSSNANQETLILLGVGAGAVVYGIDDWDGLLFSNDKNGDSGGRKPPAKPTDQPEGDVGGGGGGGGGPGDNENKRLDLILKMLLELCKAGNSEKDLSNFQSLKSLMAKEWRALARKNAELNAKSILVDIEKEKNRVERKSLEADKDKNLLDRENLDHDLEEFSVWQSAIEQREKQVLEDEQKNSADQLKIERDRGLVAEQQKQLEDALFRASLDNHTLKQMWNELQAKGAANKEDDGQQDVNPKGKDGSAGKSKGAKEPEQGSFYSRARLFVSSSVSISSEIYWFYLYVFGSIGRMIFMSKSDHQKAMEKILEKAEAKHKANQQEVENTLDGLGLPKRS